MTQERSGGGGVSIKKYSPRTANTNDKICSLRRDNLTIGNCWMLVDEENIHLVNDGTPGAHVVIDKKTFNRFLAFYNRETLHQSHRSKP